MAEKHSISRVSDADPGAASGQQEERNTLTLTGICSQDAPACSTKNRQTSGTDNYVDFGPTSRDQQVEADRQRNGGNGDRTNCPGEKVTVHQGETLWKLAEQKYGGKHPLEAIYAANGMYPKVCDKNGKIEMTDPVYGPGKYVMPDEKDIPQLTKQYRQRVEEQGRSSDKRVGGKDEATDVKLIYGDTFERMSRAKYGHEVPPEAIYAANNLQPRNVDGCLKEPIYYAGKTYTMPAEKDIPDLVRQYWDKCGHPEKCPPQYRKDGGSTGNDNYGDYGDTTKRGDQTVPPVRQDRGDGQGDRRDTKNYNEGYEDGYKDGMRRGKACACGGGGCSSCRGRGHEQRREPAPERHGGCQSCGGGGCSSCRGRGHEQRQERREPAPVPVPERHRGGCQSCGGGGCESCRGRTHRREERREREPVVVRPRVDAGCPNCGGNGCDACSGRSRDRVVYNQDRVVYDRGRDDRYYEQQRRNEINPAIPLAIMGMVLNGVMGNRHHNHGYGRYDGGYGRYDGGYGRYDGGHGRYNGGYQDYDYQRQQWEQQRQRQIWQQQHQQGYGYGQYDSEYGYGRRQQRYQQYQQYRNRSWHQGW